MNSGLKNETNGSIRRQVASFRVSLANQLMDGPLLPFHDDSLPPQLFPVM